MTDEGYEKQMLYKLLSIVQEKEQKVRRIQDITKRQSEFIANEDMNTLFKSIDEKEIYIQDIDKLDSKFGPLYEEVQKKYGSGELDNRSIPLYEKLQMVIKSVRTILTDTYREDMANMSIMRDIRGEYAGDIKRIQQGAQRQEAYSPHFPIDEGVFIDQKQ